MNTILYNIYRYVYHSLQEWLLLVYDYVKSFVTTQSLTRFIYISPWQVFWVILTNKAIIYGKVLITPKLLGSIVNQCKILVTGEQL